MQIKLAAFRFFNARKPGTLSVFNNWIIFITTQTTVRLSLASTVNVKKIVLNSETNVKRRKRSNEGFCLRKTETKRKYDSVGAVTSRVSYEVKKELILFEEIAPNACLF